MTDIKSIFKEDMSKIDRILFTGGGTGGHIYPGLAVARYIKSQNPEVQILFLGANRPLDKRILSKQEFSYKLLPIGPLNRTSLAQSLKTLFLLPIAILQAIWAVFRFRPQFCVGFGGYASAPALLASKLLGVKTAIWEPNAYPGMVSRKMAKYVDLCLLNFTDKTGIFPKEKQRLVGVPTRVPPLQKQSMNEKFFLLVIGGSSGARGINQAVSELFQKHPELLEKMDVLHQCGAYDFSWVEEKYQNLKGIECREFIHDMETQLQKASLIISRAGANSLAEIAVFAKPSILIPLPTAADNHQVKNAERFQEAGAAIMIEQKNLSVESLYAEVKRLLHSPETCRSMSEKAEFFASPHATDKIYQTLLAP